MKIAVVGAGLVGTATAHKVAEMGLGEVVIVDIVDGLAEGKALDISHALAVLNIDCKVTGSNDIAAIDGSDVVVIASGKRREPGMTRMDLLCENGRIVESVCRAVARYAPNCILIVVTNPVDVMCYVAWRTTGFPRERVIGQGGVVDSARFRWLLSTHLSVPVKDVQGMVIGEHGDCMLPLLRYTTVLGKPVTELLDEGSLQRIVERTREAGGEIVRLLKTGSAAIAPGAAVAIMVKAIAGDEHKVLPASAWLDGEYGISGVFIGVPVRLCRNGVAEIIELELADEEREWLHRSATAIRAGIEAWENMKGGG
ncbi:MAG: malate dehydrogenase [Armatimonadota bacterium]|nr:malate dehydrogenase [Armatimonadota bacterium]MCX7776747.1 malate dehydrogenase [Armatimonadota bacterium]MDW8024545.1 malate dehydrogenase [Armatimonadota bacterium]